MFYSPQKGHDLPHDPFNAIVSPRPIGWISTRGGDGSENLAPYSFFNAVAYTPPQVMFSSTSAKADRGDTKDTVANCRDTGVFCVNIVEYAARDAMNVSSGPWPRGTDEFSHAGITRTDCQEIACSRVADAPANLECRVTEILRLPGDHNFAVFGTVIGVHMREDCLRDGLFDVMRFEPLCRLGYRDYSRITSSFSLDRPDQD